MATGTAVAQVAREADFRAHIGDISRQSSIYFAGTVFATGAGYFFKVYLARVLGAEALGIYALGMTVIGFVGLFNTFGLPQSAVRFAATYTANRDFDLLRGFLLRGVTVLLIANLVCAGLVVWWGPWIGSHFYHTSGLKPLMKWLAVIMLCGALNGFLGQALAGYKQVARRTLLTNFIGTPLTICFTVGLISFGMGLQGYVLAQALSGICLLFLLSAAVWGATPALARTAGAVPPLQKEVLNFSAALFGVGMMEYALGQADAIMVGRFRNPRDVGIYAVATGLVGFVPILLQSTNQIFAPTIAGMHARGEHLLLGKIFQTITKWILGFTLPLVFVIVSFARPMMRIFGAEFEPGALVLILGACGQLINCAVGPVGFLLLMSGNQKRLIRVEFAMAALILVLNRLLIPAWGLAGAAAASAITTVGTNLWCLYEVRNSLGIWPYNRSYLRLIIPAAGALATISFTKVECNFLRPEWLQIVAAILVGFGTFVAMALPFGLDMDDRMIVGAIRNRLGWHDHAAEKRP